MGAESVDTGRNHKMPKICTGSNHKNTRDSNHETANMSADTGRNHKMSKVCTGCNYKDTRDSNNETQANTGKNDMTPEKTHWL